MQLVVLWSHDQRRGCNRWLYMGGGDSKMVCGVRCERPPWSFSVIHWLLVHDLWPLLSGCWVVFLRCSQTADVVCLCCSFTLLYINCHVHLYMYIPAKIFTWSKTWAVRWSDWSSDCSCLLPHWACFWDLSSYFGEHNVTIDRPDGQRYKIKPLLLKQIYSAVKPIQAALLISPRTTIPYFSLSPLIFQQGLLVVVPLKDSAMRWCLINI